MVLTLTRRLGDPPAEAAHTLALTAAERSRSRHHFTCGDGTAVYLNLPRGTQLRGGDWLAAEDGTAVQVVAQPEAVLTVTAAEPAQLLRAAYHLGNRHVPLEVSADYLRLEADAVLEAMLHHLGVTVTAEVTAFEPEAGAYGGHSHG